MTEEKAKENKMGGKIVFDENDIWQPFIEMERRGVLPEGKVVFKYVKGGLPTKSRMIIDFSKKELVYSDYVGKYGKFYAYANHIYNLDKINLNALFKILISKSAECLLRSDYKSVRNKILSNKRLISNFCKTSSNTLYSIPELQINKEDVIFNIHSINCVFLEMIKSKALLEGIITYSCVPKMATEKMVIDVNNKKFTYHSCAFWDNVEKRTVYRNYTFDLDKIDLNALFKSMIKVVSDDLFDCASVVETIFKNEYLRNKFLEAVKKCAFLKRFLSSKSRDLIKIIQDYDVELATKLLI